MKRRPPPPRKRDRSWRNSGKPAGPRKGLTHADRIKRDLAIVAKADSGITLREIAAEYELNHSQVGTIVRERRAERLQVLEETAMLDYVAETLSQFEQIISDTEQRARTMDDNHHAAYVGAQRLKLEAMARRWDLLRAVGKMPENLATIRVQLEAIDIANEVTGVLDAWEGRPVDDGLFEAMIAALEGKPWRGPDGQLPPGSAPSFDAESTADAA